MIPSMQDEMTTQIANDLGISDLPRAEQEALISQFGEVALKAATMSVLEKLSPDKREEFVRLSEAGDPSSIKTFLDAEVPGHDEVAKAAVAEEVKRFKAFQAE